MPPHQATHLLCSTCITHTAGTPPQGTILLFSAAASLGILRNIGGQSWAQLAPHVALTAAFTAELWHLIMP